MIRTAFEAWIETQLSGRGVGLGCPLFSLTRLLWCADYEGQESELFSFDPALSLWNKLVPAPPAPPAPSARIYSGFAAVGDALFVYGGITLGENSSV